MLMVWNPTIYRATVDIDLLAQTNNSIENISHILTEICSLPVPPDGIEFRSTDLVFAESQLATQYPGLSARFSAYLHTAKLPLRMDIGFSDQIFPSPAKINYPALLDFPSPELHGYTPETMIAEKLDTMIKRGLANSRMKDFYDVWTIVNQYPIKSETMVPVIRDVFRNRKTSAREVPKAFSKAFYGSPRAINQWESFLEGIRHDPIPFERVVLEIRDFFLPILTETDI